MNIISISLDKKIFDPNSPVTQRQKEYGTLFNELHIIVFTNKRHEPTTLSKNVHVYPTRSRFKIFAPFQAFSIAKKILEKKGNFSTGSKNMKIVWAVTAQDPFLTGLVGAWIKKKYAIPLHIQIHSTIFDLQFKKESLKNKLFLYIAEYVLPLADRVRVVSRRIQQSLAHTVDEKKITVLPIFVDVKKIMSSPISVDLHKKYPRYSTIILMASRLVPEKNIELALSAFSKIADHHPKSGLIIVGSGPSEKKLKRIVERNKKLAAHVVFEPWSDNLASYYKTADIFLLTSNHEGYAMTIIEAAAARCAIIMTNVGVAEDSIIHNENGLIIPVNEKNKLAEYLTTLIENKKERMRLGQAAQEKVQSLMTHKEYLAAYKNNLTFYEDSQ